MSGFAGEARCKRVAAQHSKGAPAYGNAGEKTRPGRLTRFRDEPMTTVEPGTWPGRLTRFREYFNADMADLADPGSHSTRRVIDIAVRLAVEDGLPYRVAGWTLWRDHRVFVPYATIQNWVEAGGEKGGAADRHRSSGLGALGLLRLYRRRRVV